MECPVIEGAVAPLCMPTEEDVEAVCGKFRGIQGHHNSCYLDVTLFSMFTYTAVFDSLLFRPKGPRDIHEYNEVLATFFLFFLLILFLFRFKGFCAKRSSTLSVKTSSSEPTT